jgi:hypothetical protein
MTDLKHDPDGVPSGPEAIARARREIAVSCRRQSLIVSDVQALREVFEEN